MKSPTKYHRLMNSALMRGLNEFLYPQTANMTDPLSFFISWLPDRQMAFDVESESVALVHTLPRDLTSLASLHSTHSRFLLHFVRGERKEGKERIERTNPLSSVNPLSGWKDGWMAQATSHSSRLFQFHICCFTQFMRFSCLKINSLCLIKI